MIKLELHCCCKDNGIKTLVIIIVIITITIIIIFIIIIIIISFFKVDFYITFDTYKKPINVNHLKSRNTMMAKESMTMSISRGHIGIVFGYRKRVTRGRATFLTVERYKHHETEIL